MIDRKIALYMAEGKQEMETNQFNRLRNAHYIVGILRAFSFCLFVV